MTRKKVGSAAMTKEASKIIHDSDCALHNAPALPAGECDCSVSDSLRTKLEAAERREEGFRISYLNVFGRIAALEAENAKLREALRAIAGGRWNTGKHKTGKTLTAQEFARAALQKDEGE